MTTYQVLSVALNIFFLAFMIGSGLWVAYDARKHGCTRSEIIAWGLFAGAFIFLGLIIYILWRNYIYRKESDQ